MFYWLSWSPKTIDILELVMNMTKKLYYEDTSKVESTAVITNFEQQDNDIVSIELDSTIFHPQGGGQPSDSGTIAEIQIFKVTSQNTSIFHLIKGDDFNKANLAVGDTVELKINKEARMLYAAYHTAGHLIDANISQSEFARHLIKPSGNHFPNQAKVSYHIIGEVDKVALKSFIETSMQHSISAALAVRVDLPDDKRLRSITIEGFSSVDCGGTHLENTCNIDKFSIRKIKHKKDKLEIGYQCFYKER